MDICSQLDIYSRMDIYNPMDRYSPKNLRIPHDKYGIPYIYGTVAIIVDM